MTVEGEVSATIGSIPQWLTAVLSLFQVVAVAAGAAIAFRGLSTWRDQKINGRRIDLAEEALRGLIELREIIAHVTNGGALDYEIERVKADFGDTFSDEQKDRAAAYAVPNLRIRDYAERIERILGHKYLTWTYFGDSVATFYDELNRILVEIKVASGALVRNALADDYQFQLGQNRNYDFYRKMEDRIWMSADPDNELNKRLAAVLVRATSFFRPVLGVGEQGSGIDG